MPGCSVPVKEMESPRDQGNKRPLRDIHDDGDEEVRSHELMCPLVDHLFGQQWRFGMRISCFRAVWFLASVASRGIRCLV